MKNKLALCVALSATIGCSIEDAGRDSLVGPGSDDDDVSTVEAHDCSPAWETPWIGSPCEKNSDCSFDGGVCLDAEDGFACGTCTLPCEKLCPDVDDTPVTFCVDGDDVGLANKGTCLSKCDSKLLDGEGCRDGYTCDVLTRFNDNKAAGVCIPEEFDEDHPDGDELVSEITHEFLIDHLGGDPVDPFDFGPDLDSFQLYLNAVGVQHVSAEEIVKPHNAGAAAGCGLSILLPGRDHWKKIGALALFTDELRDLVGEPVHLRNWWRPPCYNSAVGGAAGGDHPPGDAVDLDFLSPTSRAMAQKHLCETYWQQDILKPSEIAPGSNVDPRLNMSVGLGGVSIHLGVLSEKGRRKWKYTSYSSQPNSGTCW